MQEIRLGASGLWTDPSELEAPKGALREALNVRIRRQNCIEPRPGFPQETLGDADGPVTHVREWSGGILSVVGSDLWHVIPGDAVTKVTDADSASLSITAAESCLVEVADLLLVPTDDGVYAVDRALDAQRAGLLRPGPPVPAFSSAGPGLADGKQLAARAVIAYETESGRLVLSAPSEPVTIHNGSGGSLTINMDIALPDGVLEEMKVQLYRTEIVDYHDPVGDEMYFISETVIGPGHIASGVVTMFIATTDREGAALYTNATQEGVLQANDPAPHAKRIAWYREMAFYADIKPRHAYHFEATPGFEGRYDFTYSGSVTASGTTISGLPGGHDLEVGMYVTRDDNTGADDATFAGGTRITAVGATDVTIDTPAIGSFTGAMFFHGVITIAGNEYIPGAPTYWESRQFRSIEDLAALINSDGDVIATVTGTGYAPALLLEADASFSMSAIGLGIGVWGNVPNNATLNTERYPARLMWSKSRQPESVPAVHFLDVGRAWEPILGLGVTRDALFVLKTDGVWRVTGDSPETLRVDEYDRSIQAIHPLAITTLDDQVWAWTTSGVVALSDGGTQRVSEPSIANMLEAAQSYVLTQSRAETYVSGVFMGAAQQESVLMLGVPDPDDEAETPAAQYVYVLEAKTGAWVRWSSVDDWHSAGEYAGKIVIGGDAAIGVQAAALHDSDDAEGVTTRVEWVALVAGDPSSHAHWRGCKLLMADASVCEGFTVGFTSERVPTEGTITLATTSSTRPVVLRGSPTRNHARCQRLRVSAASSLLDQAWRMEALALTFEPMRGGERMP